MNGSLSQAAVPSFDVGNAERNPHLVLLTSGFEFIDFHHGLPEMKKDVWSGLSAKRKVLNPKLFYDEEGSRLFELLCNTPEYYPPRCEMEILKNYSEEIGKAVGEISCVIEYGSGSGKKIRHLLESIRPDRYVAIDISREQLLVACNELSALYEKLAVTAVCADYCRPLELPLAPVSSARRLAFFPGSTIGNFTPRQAVSFLRNMRRTIGEGGLLVGVDMKKDAVILNEAYNDKAGLTADFNLNLLHRLNRELGADFDPDAFRHRACYEPALGRIEMHLVSLRRQRAVVAGRVFRFDEGESIHTENSYKYTVDEFCGLARRAGFEPRACWLDGQGFFSVHYLAVA